MKAARFHAAKDIRIEEIEPPKPSPTKVLVSVEWCGICGSDLNEYLIGPFAVPKASTGPHPLTGEQLPVTMGHEISGRVSSAPASSGLTSGQKVVIDPRLFCSECPACIKDVQNCCKSMGYMGLSGGGGGLSSTVAVLPEMVHVLPDEVDLAAAALIEPLSVAWHGVKAAGIDNFQSVPVLVVGGGPVGVAVVFTLKARGAKVIVVSEPARRRREFLEPMVSGVFDPGEVDVAAKCREVAGGEGVSVVFDCAGSQAGFEAGCQSLGFRGIYVNLAVPKSPMTIPMWSFLKKEITYRASLAYNHVDFTETVDAFVAGRFQGVEKMITRQVGLEEIVVKGFEELVRPNDHIKIMATPRM